MWEAGTLRWEGWAKDRRAHVREGGIGRQGVSGGDPRGQVGMVSCGPHLPLDWLTACVRCSMACAMVRGQRYTHRERGQQMAM